MKNLISVIPFIFIIACQPASPDVESENDMEAFEILDKKPSMYAVSLAEAEKNINYYDKVAKEVLTVDPIRAFTLRSVDVVEAIGMPISKLKNAKYRHLRIYMGLDSASKQFKIYLTPVDSAQLSKGIAGVDVILSGPYTGDDDEELGDGVGPYMMDFSSPCPKTCPE